MSLKRKAAPTVKHSQGRPSPSLVSDRLFESLNRQLAALESLRQQDPNSNENIQRSAALIHTSVCRNLASAPTSARLIEILKNVIVTHSLYSFLSPSQRTKCRHQLLKSLLNLPVGSPLDWNLILETLIPEILFSGTPQSELADDFSLLSTLLISLRRSARFDDRYCSCCLENHARRLQLKDTNIPLHPFLSLYLDQIKQ